MLSCVFPFAVVIIRIKAEFLLDAKLLYKLKCLSICSSVRQKQYGKMWIFQLLFNLDTLFSPIKIQYTIHLVPLSISDACISNIWRFCYCIFLFLYNHRTLITHFVICLLMISYYFANLEWHHPCFF